MYYYFNDILTEAIQYFHNGGPVMVPLLVVSILMWAMIFDRFLFLKRMELNDIAKDDVKNYIQKNNLPDFGKYKGLKARFLRRFFELRCGKPSVDKYILDEVVMSFCSSVDKKLVYIGVLAAVSPLFGLLGTVTGMMTTFNIISVVGTGDAKAMAGGISEALISTQTGLLVAIPGMYMHSRLVKKAENLKHSIANLGFYLKNVV